MVAEKMERKDSESSDNGFLKRKSSLPPGKLRSGVIKARGRIVNCQLPGDLCFQDSMDLDLPERKTQLFKIFHL
ncbi:hypothetical protein L5515_004477 [Caenorhabditis briggsae]|uniref:Uncharacterized protein n=1 Tax=Caenorhabditis briggsae TaxID=6238 RepID=A0AAE9JDK6_CAEBR|nr:hypothetical protein L5515_004477 [Caenorhabditis briggsae]